MNIKIKTILVCATAFVLISAEFAPKQKEIEFERGNFGLGENLNYRLHWGPFNAGRATISIVNKTESMNNKPCYVLAVVGRTVGLAEVSIQIRDTWVAFLDTATYLPQKAYRDITEGKYKLKEDVVFDRTNGIAKITRKHPDRDFERLEKEIPDGVQDILGGFYQLRRVNFNKLKMGDTVAVKAFFDKENFNFKVRYKGKIKVDTDAGSFNAIKIVPLMPKNRLFDGEESVVAYISDDKNKIPLLAEVKMFVGKVKLELTNYTGLKNPINKIDKK